jgi:hypothetical protein
MKTKIFAVLLLGLFLAGIILPAHAHGTEQTEELTANP